MVVILMVLALGTGASIFKESKATVNYADETELVCEAGSSCDSISASTYLDDLLKEQASDDVE